MGIFGKIKRAVGIGISFLTALFFGGALIALLAILVRKRRKKGRRSKSSRGLKK